MSAVVTKTGNKRISVSRGPYFSRMHCGAMVPPLASPRSPSKPEVAPLTPLPGDERFLRSLRRSPFRLQNRYMWLALLPASLHGCRIVQVVSMAASVRQPFPLAGTASRGYFFVLTANFNVTKFQCNEVNYEFYRLRYIEV